VYFYSFAKKSIVCTFTRLRRRASCVLLLVCEEEHRVYFYSFAKKSKKQNGRRSAARSSRREGLLLSVGCNGYGLGRSWIDLLRLGEDQVDLCASGNADNNVLRRH
jgi:hypothetical protein